MATRFRLNFEQIFGTSAQVLAGGTLTFCISGGAPDQLQAIYQDDALTVPKLNPVTLDSAGKHGDIFLQPKDYRVILKDAAGIPIPGGDVDPIHGAVTAADVMFIQSGTGAVERPALDKLRERVSAADFGAVGDGSTDDTSALTAALTYVYSVGATLYVPAGTYRVTGLALAVTGPVSFGIVGNGPGATVLKKLGSTATPVLSIIGATGSGTNCRQSVISGMTIDGNGVANCDGLVLSNIGNLQCRSLLFQYCRFGLFGQSMIKTQHYNCEYNSSTIGAVIRIASGGVQPNFNFFYDCVAQSNQGAAFDIADGSHNVLIGADIENNGLDGVTAQVVVRNTITAGIDAGKFSMIDCHLERGQGGYDIYIFGGSGAIDADLYGLEIIGSHLHQSIMLEAGVRTATLINPFIPAAGDTVAANCDNFICTGGIIATLSEGFNNCAIMGLKTATINSYTKFRPAPSLTLGAPLMPKNNGDVIAELTDNTTLTFKAKGSDGTVRTGSVTLS